MASLEEIKTARLAKLEILKKKGINPYPSKVPRDFPITFLKTNFDAQVSSGVEVSVAGRVMAIRGQGAILFALFVDTVDVGDFISVTGKPMVSERGEQSVMTSNWIMATKSLLPLPEKW